MVIKSGAGADTPEHFRELVCALAREGIQYPPERLDEAFAEYSELQRLIEIIAAEMRASHKGTTQL